MEILHQYDQWHRHYAQSDDTGSTWHEFVKKQLDKEDLSNQLVLEVGCGRGGLSNFIASLPQPPAKVYGCDFSEGALSVARSRFSSASNIIWQQEDIQALSFPDNYFDKVISCETIEHVPNPKKALAELYRVVKPGGRVYLTCPNYFNLFGLWCVYRYLIGKPYTEFQPYVYYVVLPRLWMWLRATGFKIQLFRSSTFVLPLRAHYRFWQHEMPPLLRWLGLQIFFVLKKPINVVTPN